MPSDDRADDGDGMRADEPAPSDEPGPSDEPAASDELPRRDEPAGRDDGHGRRRFLLGAGVIGVAGATGAAAGHLAADRPPTAPPPPVPLAVGGLPVIEPAGSGRGDAAVVNRAVEQAAGTVRAGEELTGGGLVVLAGGSFTVDEPIVLRPGVVLAGSGWGTQLVRAFDGGPMVTFQASGGPVPGAYGAELRDLALNGRRGDHGGRDDHGVVLDATNPDDDGWTDPNCRVLDVRIAYCAGHGIVVARHPGSGGTTSRACRVSGCFVLACGGDGFRLEGSDAVVEGCYSSSNDGAGFAVAAGNVTVTASKASFNDGSGFVVDGQRAVLGSCQAQDNQPDGFRLTRTSGCSVTGCQADTNRRANFRLDGVTASALTGLVAVHRDAGRFGRPSDGGIVLGGGSRDCQLIGCSPRSAGGLAGSLGGRPADVLVPET